MSPGLTLKRSRALASLAALAVIVGLGLCLVHADDAGDEILCFLLAAAATGVAGVSLLLPTGRFVLSVSTPPLADFAARFAPPPESLTA